METEAGTPGRAARAYWRYLIPVLLLGWLGAESFVGTTLKLNHGQVNPPLDDTYIYYQYARQLARGQVFRYQDGEPVSTGATSPLYPVLLSPLWAVGLREGALFWGSFYLNVLGLLAGMGFVFAALRRIIPDDHWMAPLGALLVAANGWFLWGIASGMDTGLLAGALAAALHAVILFTDCGRRCPLGIALAVLGMSRPEGLVLAWVLVLALWGWRALGQPLPAVEQQGASLWRRLLRWASRWRGEGRALPWPLWAGLAVGTLPSLMLAVASGHLSTNGMVLKSHWSHVLAWPQYLEAVSNTLVAAPERLLWTPSAWLRGVLVLAVIAGLAGLWRGKLCAGADRDRGIGIAMAACCLAIFLFYGFLMSATEQHNRYYMAYVPLMVVLILAGLSTLALALPRSLQNAFRRTAALVLVLLGASSVPSWTRAYARTAGDLAEQHLAMARWMDQNLPTHAVVAINDAGALSYLGRRRVIDVFGLVTNALRAPGYWRPEGPIWEALERLRPTHFIGYPAFFDDLHRVPVMKRIHSMNLGRETLLGDREKVVYEIDWGQIIPAERPLAVPPAKRSWKLVDRLDVADVISEEEHRYRVDHGLSTGGGMFRLRSFRYGQAQVTDGARAYSGKERFRVRGLHPGRPLLLGVRSDFDAERALQVSAGSWRQQWVVGTLWHTRDHEAYLEIPASAISGSELELTLELEDRREVFGAYHYFFLQPPS